MSLPKRRAMGGHREKVYICSQAEKPKKIETCQILCLRPSVSRTVINVNFIVSASCLWDFVVDYSKALYNMSNKSPCLLCFQRQCQQVITMKYLVLGIIYQTTRSFQSQKWGLNTCAWEKKRAITQIYYANTNDIFLFVYDWGSEF